MVNFANKLFLLQSYVQTDFSEGDKALAQDSVNLEIKVQDFEANKTVTVQDVQIGAPKNLSYRMDIFPKPKNADYHWAIVDKSTNNQIKVIPGTKLYAKCNFIF